MPLHLAPTSITVRTSPSKDLRRRAQTRQDPLGRRPCGHQVFAGDCRLVQAGRSGRGKRRKAGKQGGGRKRRRRAYLSTTPLSSPPSPELAAQSSPKNRALIFYTARADQTTGPKTQFRRSSRYRFRSIKALIPIS